MITGRHNFYTNLSLPSGLVQVGNKCNRVKGRGIIYPNDVIKKLIYNIKNVRKCTYT